MTLPPMDFANEPRSADEAYEDSSPEMSGVESGGDADETGESAQGDGLDKLMEFINSDNIAKDMDPGELSRIGQECVQGFKYDWDSNFAWRSMIADVLRLAKLEKQEKSYPWPGASNVMYPLIAQATMQFAARAYPEIVQGNKVVRAQVLGDDPQGVKQEKAERIAEHMSWQLLEEVDGWEESTDKLLNMLPIYGRMYRKVYYDAVNERPAQVLLTPLECVVNANVRHYRDARRITQTLYLYENDVRERVNAGIWLDENFGEPNYYGVNSIGEEQKDGRDEAASMYCFLEQHCWLDLDEDGYEEPYIVTVEKDSSKVVRIVARYEPGNVEIDVRENGERKLVRIRPQDYFVPYCFIPSPDGCGIDVGFGSMLNAANETINSITNQLIDAGTIANIPSGFMAQGVKLSGVAPLTPGEWRKTDLPAEELAKAFFLLPTKEPSAVLFQLLGATQSNFKELVGNVDVLSGGGANANTAPGTMLAQIEQGHKVYSCIYKRIYRAMRQEFRLFAALNAKYMRDAKTFTAIGSQKATRVTPEDYAEVGIDIAPVADPNQSTAIQRVAKAQAALAGAELPGVDKYKLTKMYYGALQLDDDPVIPQDQLPKPPPDPVLMQVQADAAYNQGKLQIEMLKLEVEAAKLKLQAQDVRGKVEKAFADAILSLAKAGDVRAQSEIAMLAQAMESVQAAYDMQERSFNTVLNARQAMAQQPAPVQQEMPMPRPEMGQPGG